MLPVSFYKRISIKLGIVCGMIVTLCGSFNAVLGSIQKWNETFNKNESLTEKRLDQIVNDDVPSLTLPEIQETKNMTEAIDNEPTSTKTPLEGIFLSTGGWIVVSILGGGIMIYLMREHKKDTIRIKDKDSTMV